MVLWGKSINECNYYGIKFNPIFLGVMALFGEHVHAEMITQAQLDKSEKIINQCVQNAASSTEKAACKNSQYQSQLLADAANEQNSPIVKIFQKSDSDRSNADNLSSIKVPQEVIRTAEVTDTGAVEVPNKINSPNKSKDSKALNSKEGKNLPFDLKTEQINVRAKRFYEIGPLPGLGLTKEEIPGNVQSITAKEIKEAHSLSMTDLLNKKLQSVNVNDYQGNPFQMDVTYRGFTAGPQIGTPQGLSVFFDGIRVNEPFGDVVNWDMIPMNAIAGVDVFPGSNPIFGLNTLGGAFTLKTKDGFSNEGVDAEVLTGSYGRKQLQVEGGWNNGTVALFGAGNFFLEDGWRQNSPSKVNQFFGKGSYRGDKLDLSLSTLLVKTDLVGNGLLPSDMYAQNPASVFTAPDTTKNKLAQFQLSGSYFVSDNFTITGQVYRRDSKRHNKGADVMTGWGEADIDSLQSARRVLAPGEQWTCLLDSHNSYGLPDYYVLSLDPTTDLFSDPFFLDSLNNGTVGNPATANPGTLTFNAENLPADYVNALLAEFKQDTNKVQSLLLNRNGANTFLKLAGPVASYSSGEPVYALASFEDHVISSGIPNSVIATGTGNSYYYYTPDGKKNYVFFVSPKNNDLCNATKALDAVSENGALTYIDPNTGQVAYIDGANDQGLGGKGPGVVSYTEPTTGKTYYTPTAVLTDNNINQITDGASVQFNWNLDHHKFMIGASFDAADATYTNTSQLGLFDANRNAFLAPDLINPIFAGAFVPLSNNNFSGSTATKSLYFSETWTPQEAWHFNASGRFNHTVAKSNIAARYGSGVFGLEEFFAYPDFYAICPNGDCTGISTSSKLPDTTTVLNAAQAEKFSYQSFNPSIGLSWQAKDNLNLYANVAKGSRVPSVVELGCGFDKSPTNTVEYTDANGVVHPVNLTPKSITENRQCSLPTTLSGDPYLKQIKSTSYDVGMRGAFDNLWSAENIQWNIGAYQTDLKDDIYFINVTGTQGFFDNIGKTRRRGLEMGLSGKKDKLSLALNYSLTEATFQDAFSMISNDNSSAVFVSEAGGNYINVKPGDRMPGVPLHNLNASMNYDLTDKWSVGLSAVAHSGSYLRGNENNEHQAGVTRYVTVLDSSSPTGQSQVALQPTSNPGKVPGYATFNFQTSYKLSKEWTASMLVSNLFDKEYFSAGRLGRNPFSPSIFGAVGPDGYNHNSNDWLSTNFIAPGAPRGVWFSLNWHFEPDKK